MIKCFLAVLLIVLFVFQGFSQTTSIPKAMGGEYVIEKSHCLSDDDRFHIIEMLEKNKQELKSRGMWSSTRSPNTTLLNWPLKQADGFNYNSYYGISNYIDQNLSYPNQLLDYNCGDRTYDLSSGYNHRGTDIFIWPYGWHMVNDNQVEVIAAASGTIIGKEDGNSHTNCDFSDPNWNAVYIRHADGSVAWYGHMKNGSLTSKAIGQSVSSGEYLGVVASSGSSTGPHLHFELWEDDTYTTLVDPWAGSCNTMTNSTWWQDQKPYRESTLNYLSTNSAPVQFNTCPTPATKNEENVFQKGSRIYFTVFFHDQQSGQDVTIRILKPDGGVWSTWTHDFQNTYTSSYWYWYLDFPGTEPDGEWTFEVNYESELFSHDFQIGNNIVPINLESLFGWQKGDGIELEWRTESELNNAYFEIERSKDGIVFHSINTVEGSGTSYESKNYYYLDNSPFYGDNYYRLKQVDNDESYEYSKIINVPFINGDDSFKISVYPNPANDGVFNVACKNEKNPIVGLSVHDGFGNMINSNIPINSQVDLSELPRGIYILRIKMLYGVLYERILID